MREIDNLFRLLIFLIVILVIYGIVAVILAILRALNALSLALSQFPSSLSLNTWNPESIIFGVVIVVIIAIIMQKVTD